MDPAPWIREKQEAFDAGLGVLSRLTEGKVLVCSRAADAVQIPDSPSIVQHSFVGPHPSGLPGTHLHFLDPVSEARTAWFVNYQDVVAIGLLFLTGEIPLERVIAVGGARATKPK